MLTAGSVLENRYRIEKVISQGRAGTVYEAFQIRTGRRLAVKEIAGNSLGEGSEKSLQLLRNLKHPGLPMILDVLKAEDCIFLVMEYIEGKTLRQEMEERKKESRRFSPEEVLQTGQGICEILLYLHSRPEALLYRDLKPSNIMLKQEGGIALIDLGTVCSSDLAGRGEEEAVGTPGYAAPEQYRRKYAQGPAEDVYSLGAILHQLITGINPAENPFSFSKITKAVPELRKTCRGRQKKRLLGLEKIISLCLKFRPSDRYRNTEELLRDLQHPEECVFPGNARESLLAAASGILLVLGVFCFLLSFHSGRLTEVLRLEGKEYCLMKARRGSEENPEEWIRSALQFSPGSGECFSVLLDRMLADGVFTGEEQVRIRSLLDEKAEGEEQDHESLLRRDPEACFRFDIRMGTACLYAAEGIPDYTAAQAYLEEALLAGEEWMPEEEEEQQEKEQLVRRTEILLEITLCRWQILSGGFPEEEPASLLQYWRALTALLEEDVSAGGQLTAEIGLWREILGLLTDWPAELKAAGVEWEEQEAAAERILLFSGRLQNSTEAQEYPAVKEQLEKIEKTAESVEEKRILLEEAEGKEKEAKEEHE